MLTNNIGYVSLLREPKIDEAKTKQEQELKKVTQDFESIFLKMMIDAMDKTINKEDNPFYGGNAEEVFQGMLNEERSKDMAENGGIGLAKMLYEQLSKGIK